MPDIVHLLPDSIANQIAAGEVIQRPASVVKELVENSIDAGATHVQIIVKDAGRTLIQVIDNGKGMSVTDARMAFERHATSKIRNADDLFSLNTMGFRGEALPSIAAIAHVEVKTRRSEDEVGTMLSIVGSRVEKQEAVICAEGTIVSVKNIFFNVPARRKFLKSNEVERRHILTEIQRIALVNPHISFTLIENDVQTLVLPACKLRQRILQLDGKNMNQQLIDIEEETTLGKIFGYVTKPENAKKGKVSQYFFVNGRYIRHPYFHKAVMTAYSSLIPVNENPAYYIYFEVDPATIDVNIHPTKTEVKFENELALWQILMVTIKEALGKFNAIPSIDFDTADAIDIPIYDSSKHTPMPRLSIDPSYNPFHTSFGGSRKRPTPDFNWETLYKGFENENRAPEAIETSSNEDLFSHGDQSLSKEVELNPNHYQYKQRYILTSVKSGLMIIDQHRAHVRILFEQYLNQIQQRKGLSQRVLFPEIIELNPAEAAALESIIEDIEAVGFELTSLGNNSFAVQATPSELQNADSSKLLRSMIESSIDTGLDVKSEIHETIAFSLAEATAIPYGKTLLPDEIAMIVDRLFACKIPNHGPDGHVIVTLITDEEIAKKLK
jgi:DNA mismatch repair protein MutL